MKNIRIKSILKYLSFVSIILMLVSIVNVALLGSTIQRERRQKEIGAGNTIRHGATFRAGWRFDTKN